MSTHKDGILERARALPRSVEPQRDLWDDIEAALDGSPDRTAPVIWRPRLVVAAAVMLAVTAALSFWLGGSLSTTERVTPIATSPTTTSPTATSPITTSPITRDVPNRFGPHYAMAPSFNQARRDLAIDVADQLEQLSPESRVLVEQNFILINRALDEINDALTGDPNNDMLQQLLLSTYTQEVLLLGEIDALTRYIREGTEI